MRFPTIAKTLMKSRSRTASERFKKPTKTDWWIFVSFVYCGPVNSIRWGGTTVFVTVSKHAAVVARQFVPLLLGSILIGCVSDPEGAHVLDRESVLPVAATEMTAQTPSGEFISWKAHIIDAEEVNGVPIGVV